MKRDRYQHQQLENWDKALDQALKNLPEQPAPADLIPCVISQLNARIEEKWYQRLWWRWPLWLRATSSMLLLALAVWLPSLGSRYYETNMIPALDRSINVCKTVFSSVATALGGIPFGFDDEVCRIVFLTASLLLIVMYLTCIGVGTIIYRTVRR
jgi:hypothetical protein